MRVRAQHLLDTLTETYVDRKLSVEAEGHVVMKAGEPLRIAASALGREAVFSGLVVQEAEKHPLSAQDVHRQLGKTGDTPFAFQKLDVELSGFPPDQRYEPGQEGSAGPAERGDSVRQLEKNPEAGG